MPGVSLGSDRFRIFSAQAKGAFQCQEISPRVRFALEQSGESRRQVRDALGAGEAKDRHELGAGGLGMVLRQVGEGSAGWRGNPVSVHHSGGEIRCQLAGKSGVSSSFWRGNPVSVHHSCPKR